MRKILQISVIITLLFACKNESKKEVKDEHQHNAVEKTETQKKKPLSPHTSTMAMIGDAHIHIDYSSPGVRDRIIFGGLLAYDQVWQAGAHMATWVETNKDLQIEGKTLPAGKYGFFTIPSKEEWTVIFNSNWEQHGKDEYDEKDDVIRFKIKPNFSEEIKEQLEYKVNKIDDNNGSISLAWEKVKIEFPFKINQ
ncbi:DUF2911 domain-containing protein [Winogradskyella wandonensis]|uniref:DUF2911 domain-containing protein n=1 Tax=Winogradskyella wandonensis TaxID=1442586 RepID=UPI00104CEFB9|nr:DUF2911 domain-containing protein [Winogradskyella wandonensis]